MQLLMKIISAIAPGFIANKALHTINNPKVKKLRLHEQEVLALAQQEELAFKGFTIKTYKWGSGSKPILLVHGWEGQAGNFAEIVDALVEQDYTVHAFDAPSHGYSSQGETSVFEFSDLVTQMLKITGARLVISHSFGGVATTRALALNPEIELDRYLLLTTPDRFIDRINSVSEQVGLSDRCKRHLLQRISADYQIDISQANVSTAVKDVKVKKALIIHDVNDKVVPIAYSQNVCDNWPVCELIAIEGTGHFRILRTPEVIQKVMNFFESDQAATTQ